jgi:hypothetical protein
MANNFGQTRAKLPHLGTVQTLTTAANGVYTAQIDSPETSVFAVQLTSGGATEYAVLPKATADMIGRVIYITVGANGFELVTPASSNDTINQVDGDGTNQLDVAANSTARCTQISATGWLVELIAATTITVVAPDND